MLVILFGYPASGKNFVGEIMRDNFGFFFYDGDDDLTPEIKEAITCGKIVKDGLRDKYYLRLIKNLKGLQRKHKNIVFSQAFIKEKYRALFLDHFPEATFLYIKAPMKIIKERLKNRKHLIREEYAEKVIDHYEKPKITYHTLVNNGDKEKIKIQLHKIFNIS